MKASLTDQRAGVRQAIKLLQDALRRRRTRITATQIDVDTPTEVIPAGSRIHDGDLPLYDVRRHTGERTITIRVKTFTPTRKGKPT